MPYEVSGIDHLYLTVSHLQQSEAFYDALFRLLDFRKGTDPVGGEPHIHYYNRVLQMTLRPAREGKPPHDQFAPGLHHICLRVRDVATIDAIAQELRLLSIESSEPRYYPEYAPDYYALYFRDPDGIEWEIVNQTHIRSLIQERWEQLDSFVDPLQRLGLQ